MTPKRGVDVARWQPVNLPWPAWVADGLQVAVVQMTHGTAPEPHAAEHLAGAVAAKVPCIGGYHFLQPGNATQQAYVFMAHIGGGGPADHITFAAVDVEAEPGKPPPSGADVLEWVAAFNDELPLLLYGNYSALVAILNAHPELKRYGIWWPQYAPKPTPPKDLRIVGWQKLGSEPGYIGILPPYPKPIDITDWYEWPDGRDNVTIAPGAGHGFHGEQTNQIIPLIKRGIALGFKYKGLNSVENPGRCKDAHDLLPDMGTVCRFKMPHTEIGERWENGQNVERWDEAEHLACTRAQIQLLFDRTNPTERAGIKYYTPGINEWNLDNELSNWTCVGHHLHLMMDEAERREQEFGFPIRLAVPGISQGKPEYHQMQEMVATGCFDRMATRRDLFTIHAGRFPWQDSEAIPGLGDVIPGAPACPPYGGSYDGRVNYFYAMGVHCDFAVTEAYDGYDRFTAPATRLVRMKQADDLYRHNPHYRFICWYECVDNDDSSWRHTDFTPTFQSNVFEAEMIRESHVANPTTGDNEMSPLYHAKALIDLTVRDAAGQITTDPVATSPDGHVVGRGTTLHVYAANVTAGAFANRVTINPNGNNIWGVATAIQRV